MDHTVHGLDCNEVWGSRCVVQRIDCTVLRWEGSQYWGSSVRSKWGVTVQGLDCNEFRGGHSPGAQLYLVRGVTFQGFYYNEVRVGSQYKGSTKKKVRGGSQSMGSTVMRREMSKYRGSTVMRVGSHPRRSTILRWEWDTVQGIIYRVESGPQYQVLNNDELRVRFTVPQLNYCIQYCT
jgi:hypothetical protein